VYGIEGITMSIQKSNSYRTTHTKLCPRCHIIYIVNPISDSFHTSYKCQLYVAKKY